MTSTVTSADFASFTAAGNTGEVGAARIGARCRQHFQRLRRRGRDALEHGDHFFGFALRTPRAESRQAVGRQGADHGDAAQLVRIQRQELALVLEQHHRLARDRARRCAMLGVRELARLAFGVVVLHRLVEQPELFLHAQDAQHRLVELFEARRVFRDGVLQVIGEHAAHHVHVHRSIEREHAGRRAIRRDAMIDELADRAPVADHEPLPAPAFTQRAAQQILVGRGGNTGDVVERRHERTGAGARRGVERR